MDILLVDDHEVLRAGVRRLLDGRDGWRVCGEAGDGREAVALAAALAPDVVVLDFTLPGLNGVEATRRIREVCPEARVVLFTMHAQGAIARDALRAGATGLVVKSDGADVLLAAIEAAGARRRFVTPTLADAVREPPPAAARAELTPREREVVQLLAEGRDNAAIAALLEISTKTVEAHRIAAMRQLGATSTVELVRWALRSGLVEP